MNPGEITKVAIIGTILVSGALLGVRYIIKKNVINNAIKTQNEIESNYTKEEISAMKENQPQTQAQIDKTIKRLQETGRSSFYSNDDINSDQNAENLYNQQEQKIVGGRRSSIRIQTKRRQTKRRQTKRRQTKRSKRQRYL